MLETPPHNEIFILLGTQAQKGVRLANEQMVLSHHHIILKLTLAHRVAVHGDAQSCIRTIPMAPIHPQ